MLKRRKKKTFPPSSFFDKIKERGIPKNRKIKVILSFLVFVFLFYRFSAGPYGFFQIHTLREEKRNLEHESRLIKAEIFDLELEKQRLSHDPFYLEKQARERLGLIKPGEKMYRIVRKIKPDDPKLLQTSPPDSASR